MMNRLRFPVACVLIALLLPGASYLFAANTETDPDQKEAKQMEAVVKWRDEISQLVAETKKTCLEANSSADLDGLFVKLTAIQMRRARTGGILDERADRKLQGVSVTLHSWVGYFDYRDAGKTKAANDVFQRLINESSFPVLTVQEIRAHFIANADDAARVHAAVTTLQQSVHSPDDLPALMSKLAEMHAADPARDDLTFLANDQYGIKAVVDAWEAVKAGNDAEVTRASQRYSISNAASEMRSFLDRQLAQVLNVQLQAKAQTWTKLTPNPGEGALSYTVRILDELQVAENYAAMLEVLKSSGLARYYERPDVSFNLEFTAIEQFVAAKRFEQLNDDMAALTNYRFVIASTGGKYVPMAEAEEGIKRLRARNPQVFKSYEGVLAEELRDLRQQMQSLLNRPPSMGRPFPY